MKLAPLIAPRTLQPCFPPHSCGGLIEAPETAEKEARACLVFPRIRAGASLKQQRAAVAGGDAEVFPRIRAGASLKQGGRAALAVLPRCFPPHSCGGLIEARLDVVSHDEGVVFSPAFVRGPH